ncbi:MAG: efflux RND transporter permease subunit [Gammaproteobacteria bacterium]|jgi:multidrug efflux pump subunit AcrB|nr:efflux RND transporter permease subunit [Gammaproteobacteria bacterium]
MFWFQRFLSNHVLANLTFTLVIVLGVLSYFQMPRAKDPEINFNWVNVITVFPGASAIDIERRITEPLEDSLRRTVKDMRFVLSTSRDGISNILVRFNQIDEREFDKRVIDLRREIQNTYTDELPTDADDPVIYEIGTSNAFPSAMIVVSSAGDDENLRRRARNVRKDIERIKGVDRVDALGLSDPELHVSFLPDRLEGLGITPADIADTIRIYFRDQSAGDLDTRDGKWIIRVQGTSSDPSVLRDVPVVTAKGIVTLGSIAELSRTREEPSKIVRYNGQPAVTLTVTKQAKANVLELVDRINEYIGERNQYKNTTGAEVFLIDDQTISTREALDLMQTNAFIGLVLVLLVTWIFLGTRIALLTSIGIPFTLAGTFLIVSTMGITLNNTVLLGVVIALGMLVDDAVVVVESIYQRLQHGLSSMNAVIKSLQEVFAPVTTSVMTTIAAFLPLMLLPGILGDFMKVIPLVVTLALLVSLVEAYWMLPSHILAAKVNFTNPDRIQIKREAMTHWVRLRYTQILLKSLRHPIVSMIVVFLVLTLATGTMLSGHIRFNFFESDAIRLFYVNVEMPQGTSLEETSEMLEKVEKRALQEIEPGELRASVSFAGQQFTQTEPLFGDTIGQVMFSLNPETRGSRHVFDVADDIEAAVKDIPGPVDLYILRMEDGPPTEKAISVKIRGDEYPIILEAANHLRTFLRSNDAYNNVSLDYRPGNPELVLRFDGEAIQRSGLSPNQVSRTLQAYVDGEIVTDFQDQGEEVKVRVLSIKDETTGIENLLRQSLSLANGQSIALSELLIAEPGFGQQNIRHYNFRRAITLESDVDKEKMNTVEANKLIEDEWARVQSQYPSISLDFSGELDDIQESLDAIGILFLLGLGLIYIILGTQFRSYFQPLMIIFGTVPLAFTGVVLGLLITGNPLSLYTMYGVVALAGISVNAAIVLISAANSRLENGMSLLHATVYAARRRVIPILITSLTTVAGLFSLAAGLAGQSLIWGPVATAIVWGLAFSTVLTLFVIPFLYRTFMAFSPRVKLGQH